MKEIRRVSKDRPGFWQQAISIGKLSPCGFYLETESSLDGLPIVDLDVQREQKLREAMDQSNWPAWAKALAFFSDDKDEGVGDTITRMLAPMGGDAFKKWHQEIFGQPCGCSGRQAELNRLYPLREF